MTKIFCDRCKTEINDNSIYRFDIQGPRDSWDGELCENCYKAFVSFMRMEDSLYHTNPGNHGIERMTFGSR